MAKTTQNVPEKPKSRLDTLLAGRNKPVNRPTMQVLPSEMQRSRTIKMDIFNEEDDESGSDNEANHFSNV